MLKRWRQGHKIPGLRCSGYRLCTRATRGDSSCADLAEMRTPCLHGGVPGCQSWSNLAGAGPEGSGEFPRARCDGCFVQCQETAPVHEQAPGTHRGGDGRSLIAENHVPR